MRNVFKSVLQKTLNILEYPSLLRTIGKQLDREFVKELLFIRQRLGITPRAILDVGAANGTFARAARFVFPDAAIHMFEPVPDHLGALQHLLDGDALVHVHTVALSSKEGSATFYVNDFRFSSSLLKMTPRHKEVFPFTEGEQTISVECRRLDSFPMIFVQKPVLLKIDVQGAEMEVLKGAGRLLQECDAVMLESSFEPFYENQAAYPELISYMNRSGFRSFLQIAPHFVGTKLTHCDLLFLR